VVEVVIHLVVDLDHGGHSTSLLSETSGLLGHLSVQLHAEAVSRVEVHDIGHHSVSVVFGDDRAPASVSSATPTTWRRWSLKPTRYSESHRVDEHRALEPASRPPDADPSAAAP
jgi:hypothetical protein